MADETATEGATHAGATATETAPAFTSEHERMLDRLRASLGADAVIDAVEVFHDFVVRVAPSAWQRAAQVARHELGLDYLSFISGIDWMPAPVIAEEGSGDTSSPVQPREQTPGAAGAAGRFQVFAHVASTRIARAGLTLKADVDDADPRVESWTGIYPGADWHERETWEMYGFVFDGHPALRHLYLPTGFEGHPLRKDFPLLAREVKPWPGLVDVEAMPGEAGEGGASGEPAGEGDEEASA